MPGMSDRVLEWYRISVTEFALQESLQVVNYIETKATVTKLILTSKLPHTIILYDHADLKETKILFKNWEQQSNSPLKKEGIINYFKLTASTYIINVFKRNKRKERGRYQKSECVSFRGGSNDNTCNLKRFPLPRLIHS